MRAAVLLGLLATLVVVSLAESLPTEVRSDDVTAVAAPPDVKECVTAALTEAVEYFGQVLDSCWRGSEASSYVNFPVCLGLSALYGVNKAVQDLKKCVPGSTLQT